MSTERYIVRTTGGPFPGDRVADTDWHEWPPPDHLDVPSPGGGRYHKISESGLPPASTGALPGVVRGAEYEWVPALLEEM